jgi:hypothetical protein
MRRVEVSILNVCKYIYVNGRMCMFKDYVCVCGSKELLIDYFFLQNRDGRLPLHFAATNTSVEKFKSLLGAFPNAGGAGQ